jgi:hypothetical protein
MDLSEQSAPQEQPVGLSHIDLLPTKKREENFNLAFRVISFIIAICLGAYFLCVGLQVAKDSALHIREIQKSAIEIKKEQLNSPPVIRTLTQSGNTKITKVAEKKKASINGSKASENNDSFLFSTGSLLTLIAFIFGVGLTLLLSVLKFVFIKSEDKGKVTSPDIATPLSELIKGLADWLKKKAS